MSDEYKEQLLNYITNKLTLNEATNNPFREQFVEIKNNLDTYINQKLEEQTYGYAEFYVDGSLQVEGNSIYLFHGHYWKTEHNREYKGFIVMVDENFNPIQLITKYSTGTDLRRFQDVKVDEDGRLYAVDILNIYYEDVETITKRFVLLNNIFISNVLYGDYEVVLRNSYNLNYNYVDVEQVYKKIGSADYMMVGYNTNNSNKISVITLTINVGSQNEWNIYNSNYQATSGLWGYLTWDENTTDLRLVTNNVVSSKVKYLEFKFDGSNFSTITTYNLMKLGEDYLENYMREVIIKDNDEVYYQIDYFDIIFKTNYDNNSYDVIYYGEISETNFYYYFVNINNNIFLARYYSFYDDQSESHYCLKYGLIENNQVYFSDEFEMSDGIGRFFSKGVFNTKTSFNLNELTIQAGNYIEILPVDYNPLNYNGASYINYNLLKSHKATLYKNNRLLFSRNLYNKVVNNNSITSTVQLPNTMLNNIEINKENLISETNLSMDKEQLSLTKNIYETVYFNFTNTINVIDEDENKSYPTVANYVTGNINTGTQSNYTTTAITKVRINYTDDTNKIVSINWNYMNTFNKKTNFIVYTEKQIKNIEFISNDESFVYLTKTFENEVGKYYLIKQKIRTGEKAIPTPLLYENEQINYNNDEVFVYS